MKKIILVIALFQMTAFAKAQPFEFIYSTFDDEYILDAAEDTAGNYYLLGSKGTNNTYNPILIKLNSAGDTVKTVTLTQPPFGWATLRQVLRITDTTFAAIGTLYDWNLSLNQIWYVKFDTGLNILDQKEIGDPAREHFVCSIHKSLKNEILIAGSSSDSSSYDVMIYRLSLDGDSLQSFYIGDTSINNLSYDVLDLPDSSGYIISGMGLVQDGHFEIIRTDNNGIIDTSYELTAFSILGGLDLLRLTDSTYALCGSRFDTSTFSWEPKLSFNVLDQNFNWLSDTLLGPPDTLDHTPLRSMDLITPEHVFGGASINWHGWIFEPYTSFYHAIKFNNNMQVQWEKIISHNDDFLNMWSVIATNDGGVLLSGSRYNVATSNGQERDIYVVKLDSLGNFTTGINNQIATQMHDVIVYPIPAHDIINIRSTINFPATEFNLYDAEGRKVMDKKFQKNATFSVSQLKAGIYFYKIKDAKGNEVRGKVVKE